MSETGKNLKLRDEMFEQKMKNSISERLDNPDWDYNIARKVVLREKYGNRKKILVWALGASVMLAITVFSVSVFNQSKVLSETPANNLITTSKSQVAGKAGIIRKTPEDKSKNNTEIPEPETLPDDTKIVEDMLYLAANRTTPEEHTLNKEFREVNGFFPGEFGVDELIDNVLDKRFAESPSSNP